MQNKEKIFLDYPNNYTTTTLKIMTIFTSFFNFFFIAMFRPTFGSKFDTLGFSELQFYLFTLC